MITLLNSEISPDLLQNTVYVSPSNPRSTFLIVCLQLHLWGSQDLNSNTNEPRTPRGHCITMNEILFMVVNYVTCD